MYLDQGSKKLSKPLDIDLWFPSEEVKNQWFDTYDYLLPVESTIIPACLYKQVVRVWVLRQTWSVNTTLLWTLITQSNAVICSGILNGTKLKDIS